MPHTDGDVERMLAFREGDEAAFDALFDHWAGPLLHFLEAMVGDTATAEDLVQEAFLRVYRARQRYEPRARFSTWLYRIATNLALNELKRPRRRHVHQSDERHELHSKGVASDVLLDARREGAVVERELARLPERQRAALWLCAVEGKSYAQAAEVLEASEKSVKALVHRGRATLLARMKVLRAERPAAIGER